MIWLRLQTSSAFAWIRVLTALLFLHATVTLADPSCAHPKVMNENQLKNKLNDELEECPLSEEIQVKACKKALAEARRAVSSFESKMSSTCREIDKSKDSACPPDQKDCFSGTGNSRSQAAAKLRAVAADLEKHKQTIDKDKKELLKAMKTKSVEETSRDHDSFNRFHRHTHQRGEAEKSEIEEGKSEAQKAGSTFVAKAEKASSSNTITGTIPQDTSKILHEQAEAVKAIATFQSQISGEIARLNTLANSLDGTGKTLSNRAEKQDSLSKNAKDNQSDPQNSDKQPQSDGAQKIGSGGSGQGGGEGGGQSSGSPSGISEPVNSDSGATSPTPTASNDKADSGSKASSNMEKAVWKDKKDRSTETGLKDPDKVGIGQTSSKSEKSLTQLARSGAGVTTEKKSPELAKKLSRFNTGIENLNFDSSRNRTGASDGAENSSSAGGSGTSAASGGSGASSSEAAASGEGSEDLGNFDKSTGSSSFSLAGSETDASVKAMLEEFEGKGEANDEGRDPASEAQQGIGEQEGQSLFERIHTFHERCAQRRCVSVFRSFPLKEGRS